MCLSLGDIDESVVTVESLEIVPEGSTEEEEEEEEEEAAAIEADDESERNVCCDNNQIVLTKILEMSGFKQNRKNMRVVYKRGDSPIAKSKTF